MKLNAGKRLFSTTTHKLKTPVLYDRWLLLAFFCLLSIGLLMVASASAPIAERQLGNSFYFLWRQMIFAGLGLLLLWFTFRCDSYYWQKISLFFLLASFVLLIMVLIPGIGKKVNGSARWISLVFFNIQVSEVIKLFFIVYLASYLARRQHEVRYQLSGFIKPLILVGILGGFLLLEPDLGATVVIGATVLGMLFLAGVPWPPFVIMVGLAVLMLAGLILMAPYRWARLISFLDPWAYAFDSGYQLTQALIAFGRGSWFGTGLGDSVQKLFYLPEPHTDFIFAVLAEELGLLGALLVIGLFTLLIARLFWIGRTSQQLGRDFVAYLAYGIGFCLALQFLINLGVNMGLLPTKGLTLPLISYGGSSLLITCMMIGIALRIDHENRLLCFGWYHPRC